MDINCQHVLNNTFRKIFATKSFDVAIDCVLYFGCAVQDTLCRRKSKFLTKLKYKTTSNSLYHAVQKVVSDELAELQKIIIMRCLENVPLVLVLCVFIYHVVVNVISIVHIR